MEKYSNYIQQNDRVLGKNVIIDLKNVDLEYNFRSTLSFRAFVKNFFVRDEQKTKVSTFKALDSIDLELEHGKVYGLIGNNGAGKTTLLKVLAGIISPTRGNISWGTKSIGLLSLGAGFSGELTGRENIILNGLLLGMSQEFIKENIDKIISFAEIGDFINKPVRTYSSGMVSRLGFSIIINIRPEVLLIDEVLSVGDINFREKSGTALREYIFDTNTTVVIVQHSMEQIKNLCDKAIWLEKGHIVKIGDAEQIADEYLNKTIPGGVMHHLDRFDASYKGTSHLVEIDEYADRKKEGSRNIKENKRIDG